MWIQCCIGAIHHESHKVEIRWEILCYCRDFNLAHQLCCYYHDFNTLFNLNDVGCMSIPQKVSDLEIFLSVAITNQYTCLDSSSRYNLRQNLEDGLMNISHLVSNSLAIVKYIASQVSRPAVNSIHNRRLLSGDQDSDFMIMESDGFPSWMSAGQRTNIQRTKLKSRA